MNVIKRFNKDEALKEDQIKRIEDYFYYRWDKDKNLAFNDEGDVKLLETLPIGIQQDLYRRFLFEDFFIVFRKHFSMEVPCAKKGGYFNWSFPVYSNFMCDLVKKMEPVFEEENTFIYIETEEVTEVLYFVEGIFDIGFELNDTKNYVLRY